MAVVRAAVMIFITVAFIFLVVITAAVVIAATDADVLYCSRYWVSQKKLSFDNFQHY